MSVSEPVTKTVTATGEVVFWMGDTPEGDRLEMCEWLRHHSIDPGEFAGPNFMEIDRKAHTIRWISYDLTDRGGRFPLPDSNHASVSVREVQLDGPILDLPTFIPCAISASKDVPHRHSCEYEGDPSGASGS